MKLVFVCAAGRFRSKKAAELFSKDHETSYFGMSKYVDCWKYGHEMRDYTIKHLEKTIDEADLVFVMESWMKEMIEMMLKHSFEKIIVLGIEDHYVLDEKMPELEKILMEKITPYLTGCS